MRTFYKSSFLLGLFLAAPLALKAEVGDVNGDGVVSGADVTALYNVLLDGATADGNADVNNDGVVSGADVTALYNILLNGAPEPPAKVTEYTVNGVTFKMVDVEGGTFDMGAIDGDSYAEAQEQPVHQVTLSSFAIGQTEVTQELWQAVMGSNPSLYEGDKLPAHSISWQDCQDFVAQLNSQLPIDGYKFAMPTEAQWEYAARGGNMSKGTIYAGRNDISNVAWYKNNSDNQPHNVGLKGYNELGLYDMSGNVDEWCQDWKANYDSEAQFDPAGPENGTYRVARGGHFAQPQRYCRVTARTGYRPTGAGANIGLRLVLVPMNKETITVNGVNFDIIKVEGGTFTMGGSNNSDESPTHQVTLTSFFIGQTEVTQELWEAVMGSNPSQHTGSNLPVENVSWNDCQEFITKLNKMTGKHFRLPTEAEWEYAARGGNKSQGYNYSGSNTLDDVAWYYINSNFESHLVGAKQANELGVYDMNGNVWEWCIDWYGGYSAEAQSDPTGPNSGSERIQRGGSFEHDTWAFPLSFRNAMSPDYKHKSVGLRLVEGPTANEIISINNVVFNMIKVDGGTFMMGAIAGDEKALDDEYPVHQVTLSTFSIGQTEVTQELWEAVMGSNPSQHVGANLPVDYVSWLECQEFITKLNAATGRNFRLPTEAEWEFAARGGNLSKGYLYAGSNDVDEVAWHTNNSGRVSQPVATKAPNELGLYDMSGNVQELCLDWYADQYPADSQVDPIGPSTGIARITRGGCWAWYTTDYCRVTFRDNALPNERKSYIGLRLVEGPISKEIFSINNIVFNMIKVDGGTFMMGASDDDTEAYEQEHPAHQVTLSTFLIGETEVTEALWKAVMDGALPSAGYTSGDNYPVRFVRWDAAQEFITKLNELTGREFALPTDAQWEFAARGGNLSQGYKYSGSNTLDDVAWYEDNSEESVHEVATKAPNELGIYDMTGNVYEWCGDDAYYYTADSQVNPFFPGTTMNKMMRSSCWLDPSRDCRNTARWLTNGVGIFYGLRLALKQ
ncbi:MAG: SUMF1/EgtB/PvdO family nonheme iron enzyme [Muribaculaceae bacterium]|nr:SUMF1/EgtB/PvdO family nonheme iron enzyme [Muribaculaceae bacterium]